MSPVLILLVGMAIVIGGILAFRLHAFLALLLAALIVAGLTSSEQVLDHEWRSAGLAVTEVDGDAGVLRKGNKQQWIDGRGVLVRPAAGGGFEPAGEVTATELGQTNGLIRVRLTGAAAQPGDRYLHHTQMKAARKSAGGTMAARVARGFGGTCEKIGILIAMAAIVGKCLMDSGAAERIVLGLRRAFGERRTPLAFIGSGFTLGIPVFFDTVFYLMIPLGKALRAKTGKDYLLYVLTIVAGGTMAHSLVPPTPGPLFVAEELGVSLGAMIVGGCVVGLFTASSGYFFARWANRRWEVPLRPSAELSEADLQAMAQRDESELPGLFVSLLPILLPVVLLAGGTAYDTAVKSLNVPPGWLVGMGPTMDILGDKNIALMLAAACGLLLLVRHRRTSREDLAGAVGSALASGGVIILITAAGGAFGFALRQTDIAGTIGEWIPATKVGILPVAFLLTTVIRTAQGSATVAMITAVGILSPLVAEGLAFHPLYLALAIGCGSKPISWMNDSGFWVISRMSGLTEAEMLKTNTIMGCVMATVGLVLTMAGAVLLPLV